MSEALLNRSETRPNLESESQIKSVDLESMLCRLAASKMLDAGLMSTIASDTRRKEESEANPFKSFLSNAKENLPKSLLRFPAALTNRFINFKDLELDYAQDKGKLGNALYNSGAYLVNTAVKGTELFRKVSNTEEFYGQKLSELTKGFSSSIQEDQVEQDLLKNLSQVADKKFTLVRGDTAQYLNTLVQMGFYSNTEAVLADIRKIKVGEEPSANFKEAVRIITIKANEYYEFGKTPELVEAAAAGLMKSGLHVNSNSSTGASLIAKNLIRTTTLGLATTVESVNMFGMAYKSTMESSTSANATYTEIYMQVVAELGEEKLEEIKAEYGVNGEYAIQSIVLDRFTQLMSERGRNDQEFVATQESLRGKAWKAGVDMLGVGRMKFNGVHSHEDLMALVKKQKEVLEATKTEEYNDQLSSRIKDYLNAEVPSDLGNQVQRALTSWSGKRGLDKTGHLLTNLAVSGVSRTISFPISRVITTSMLNLGTGRAGLESSEVGAILSQMYGIKHGDNLGDIAYKATVGEYSSFYTTPFGAIDNGLLKPGARAIEVASSNIEKFNKDTADLSFAMKVGYLANASMELLGNTFAPSAMAADVPKPKTTTQGELRAMVEKAQKDGQKSIKFVDATGKERTVGLVGSGKETSVDSTVAALNKSFNLHDAASATPSAPAAISNLPIDPKKPFELNLQPNPLDIKPTSYTEGNWKANISGTGDRSEIKFDQPVNRNDANSALTRFRDFIGNKPGVIQAVDQNGTVRTFKVNGPYALTIQDFPNGKDTRFTSIKYISNDAVLKQPLVDLPEPSQPTQSNNLFGSSQPNLDGQIGFGNTNGNLFGTPNTSTPVFPVSSSLDLTDLSSKFQASATNLFANTNNSKPLEQTNAARINIIQNGLKPGQQLFEISGNIPKLSNEQILKPYALQANESLIEVDGPNSATLPNGLTGEVQVLKRANGTFQNVIVRDGQVFKLADEIKPYIVNAPVAGNTKVTASQMWYEGYTRDQLPGGAGKERVYFSLPNFGTKKLNFDSSAPFMEQMTNRYAALSDRLAAYFTPEELKAYQAEIGQDGNPLNTKLENKLMRMLDPKLPEYNPKFAQEYSQIIAETKALQKLGQRTDAYFINEASKTTKSPVDLLIRNSKLFDDNGRFTNRSLTASREIAPGVATGADARSAVAEGLSSASILTGFSMLVKTDGGKVQLTIPEIAKTDSTGLPVIFRQLWPGKAASPNARPMEIEAVNRYNEEKSKYVAAAANYWREYKAGTMFKASDMQHLRDFIQQQYGLSTEEVNKLDNDTLAAIGAIKAATDKADRGDSPWSNIPNTGNYEAGKKSTLAYANQLADENNIELPGYKADSTSRVNLTINQKAVDFSNPMGVIRAVGGALGFLTGRGTMGPEFSKQYDQLVDTNPNEPEPTKFQTVDATKSGFMAPTAAELFALVNAVGGKIPVMISGGSTRETWIKVGESTVEMKLPDGGVQTYQVAANIMRDTVKAHAADIYKDNQDPFKAFNKFALAQAEQIADPKIKKSVINLIQSGTMYNGLVLENRRRIGGGAIAPGSIAEIIGASMSQLDRNGITPGQSVEITGDVQTAIGAWSELQKLEAKSNRATSYNVRQKLLELILPPAEASIANRKLDSAISSTVGKGGLSLELAKQQAPKGVEVVPLNKEDLVKLGYAYRNPRTGEIIYGTVISGGEIKGRTADANATLKMFGYKDASGKIVPIGNLDNDACQYQPPIPFKNLPPDVATSMGLVCDEGGCYPIDWTERQQDFALTPQSKKAAIATEMSAGKRGEVNASILARTATELSYQSNMEMLAKEDSTLIKAATLFQSGKEVEARQILAQYKQETGVELKEDTVRNINPADLQNRTASFNINRLRTQIMEEKHWGIDVGLPSPGKPIPIIGFHIGDKEMRQAIVDAGITEVSETGVVDHYDEKGNPVFKRNPDGTIERCFMFKTKVPIKVGEKLENEFSMVAQPPAKPVEPHQQEEKPKQQEEKPKQPEEKPKQPDQPQKPVDQPQETNPTKPGVPEHPEQPAVPKPNPVESQPTQPAPPAANPEGTPIPPQQPTPVTNPTATTPNVAPPSATTPPANVPTAPQPPVAPPTTPAPPTAPTPVVIEPPAPVVAPAPVTPVAPPIAPAPPTPPTPAFTPTPPPVPVTPPAPPSVPIVNVMDSIPTTPTLP